MSWLGERGFSRRPLVHVEDHLFHTHCLLEAIERAAPDRLAELTVVCLDRPGPDTTRSVSDWLDRYQTLQVAAQIDGLQEDSSSSSKTQQRLRFLDSEVTRAPHFYSKAIASLLRPRGLLVQDIQLETLSFASTDRWWETIYLASTVRGMYADRPPQCRFLSNKRGYEATFGRDLLETGFDPRDVMPKEDLEDIVVPVLDRYLRETFSATLHYAGSRGEKLVAPLATSEGDREEIEQELDLLLWPTDAGVELSGRSVRPSKDGRWRLPSKGNEALTWSGLLSDYLDGGNGLPVVDVGLRVAAPGALKAEATNSAARHVHSMRKRLRNSDDVSTVEHAYRLRDGLKIGVCHRRS